MLAWQRQTRNEVTVGVSLSDVRLTSDLWPSPRSSREKETRVSFSYSDVFSSRPAQFQSDHFDVRVFVRSLWTDLGTLSRSCYLQQQIEEDLKSSRSDLMYEQ